MNLNTWEFTLHLHSVGTDILIILPVRLQEHWDFCAETQTPSRNLPENYCTKLIYGLYSKMLAPYGTLLDKTKLEKIQSLASRYVLGKLAKQTNISRNTRLNLLHWESLEHRRTLFRLKLFHDVYFSRIGIPRETYIFPPHYISARTDHIYKAREIDCKSTTFLNSFFPKTIRQWNRLPSSVLLHNSSDSFLSTVTSLEGLN